MTALIIAVLTLGLILSLGIRGTLYSHQQTRRARWRIRFRLRAGAGYATLAEILIHWTRLAALRHGRDARPDLTLPARITTRTSGYAVSLGRAQYGLHIRDQMTRQTMIIAPPRTGKTSYLAGRILDHPGAVLNITTRADVYGHTAARRAALGPVHVWNPSDTGRVSSTFAWDIVAGCEDAETAFRRAAALIGPPGQGDMAWWTEKAATTLAALLHCAALRGADMRTVWRWSTRNAADELAAAARLPGASLELFASTAEIQREGKSADSVRLTMSKSLAWVAAPALLSLASGPGARPFDAAAWALGTETIYMIAPDGNNSITAPLFRAFLEDVHYDAALAGSRMPWGKLPVPALLALDEVTQTVSPPLAQWLADSAGKGISIAFICHSTGQLAERYGERAASAIWSLAGTKMFLPGISDKTTLEDIAAICGTTGAGEDRRPAVPPDLVRTLPAGRALIVSMNRSPVVVKTRPVWKRRGRAAPAPPAIPSDDTQPIPAVTAGPPPGAPGSVPPARIPEETPADDIPA